VKDERRNEEARSGLVPAFPPGTTIFQSSDVIEAVAKQFGFAVADLRGPRRTRNLSEARDGAYLIIREHSRMCLQQMAECMGRSDHTGVLWAVRRAAQRREVDAWFRDSLAVVERELEAKTKGVVAA
jgi:chromosomal replication initiation ATPase DnaA